MANKHGAVVAIQLDPVGKPGVFTTIAELVGDIVFPPPLTPVEDFTRRLLYDGDGLDEWVAANLKSGQITLQFAPSDVITGSFPLPPKDK